MMFGPPTRTDYRLYVENLSSTTSWQDLKDIMRKGGEVTFADKQGQRGGIVEFASKSEMKAALKKCDGMEVDGKRIRVTEERRSRSASRDRDSRSRTRTRSRSRSVSRSRSRTRSRTPANKGSSGAKDAKKDSGAKKSRSRSVSRSRSRSVSRSRTRS